MLNNYLYISLILCVISADDDQCTKNKSKPPHLEIREHILCDYDKTIRPVINDKATPLEVKLLVQHFDYDGHNGVLEVTAFLGARWEDEHLHWDPEKYSSVETILAGTEEIWTPDLTIYNRITILNITDDVFELTNAFVAVEYARVEDEFVFLEGNNSMNESEKKLSGNVQLHVQYSARLLHKGGYGGSSKLLAGENSCIIFYHKKVICVAEVTISGVCFPDYRHYPFDVQNCTLGIGSWYHKGEEIDLGDTEVMTDVGSYSQDSLNPEWKLISLTYKKNLGIFKEIPNSTYPSLSFVFVVKRNAAAKFAILIVPVLVLIAITILSLWLDPTSSDRIFISVVNIPLHVMYLLNFQWDLPESGPSVPYLIQLMRNSELIVLLILIETVIVRHLLQRTKESPRFLVNIFTITAESKIGQLLLFLELNPEGAAENLTADDSSNLVEMVNRPKEWYLLGKVIDRLAFIGSILAYLIMFIFYASN